MPAPQRTARIEDDICDPAQERAKAEGASHAALMRAAVQAYATYATHSIRQSRTQPSGVPQAATVLQHVIDNSSPSQLGADTSGWGRGH